MKFSETNLDLTPSPTSSALPLRPSEETKVDRKAKKVCQINILQSGLGILSSKDSGCHQDQHPGKAVKVMDLICD